jgi:hypothetical protein
LQDVQSEIMGALREGLKPELRTVELRVRHDGNPDGPDWLSVLRDFVLHRAVQILNNVILGSGREGSCRGR